MRKKRKIKIGKSDTVLVYEHELLLLVIIAGILGILWILTSV